METDCFSQQPKSRFCLRANRKMKQMCQLGSSTSSFKAINLNRKTLVLGAILVTLAVFLLNPTSRGDQLVEGKKAKKAIKSIVKGLILQNLSTRKNFLPLPVPIPGKWQKVFSTMLDSGVLDNKSALKKLNLKDKATDLKGKQSLLMSASNLVDTLSRGKKLAASSSSLSSSSGSDSSSTSLADMNNIKKLTRLAAATYAGRLISIGAPGTSSGSTGESTSNKLKGTGSALVQKATSSSSGSNLASDSGHKRNDVLVTAFNVVKLAQQIRELDPSKLLNISKKTSLSSSPTSARYPLLSMNINNRKTFMNKMHYIHKLTYDLHHRHRNNQNMLAFVR